MAERSPLWSFSAKLPVVAGQGGGGESAVLASDVEWVVISAHKACEENREGITRLSGAQYGSSQTLADCQRDCANTADCMAVDW